LAGKGVKHDAKNFKEQTAYMVAAMCNQPGVMDVLFKRKVNVNAQDALGNTALHHAAALGVMKSVNKCIADGAKLDVLNKARQMPIDIANGTAVKKLLTTKMAK
jgi:ankyrin repeat protein